MIGERLEEARKRKGVSIREVAEATKIRGDYLLAMEDNSFEIPLPQIYIRGFLKNYARYLQLDSNKILTDYDAHLLGRSNLHAAATTRSQRESYGHVEIPAPEEEEEEDAAHSPEERVVITEAPEDDGPEPELRFSLEQKPESRKTPPPPTLDRKGTRHDQEIWNENKTLYMKIGVILAAIILISTIMVVLIQLLRSEPDTPAINPDLASSPAQTQQPAVQTTPGDQLQSDSFTISATDDVTLIIEQTMDRKRLWSGTLNAGETLSLDKEGPVSIRFTNGSALTIEKDGQKVRPPQEGVGRTVVD